MGSEDVLDTTASDEPAVQVLRTTGLPVGGDEAVLKTNARGESAVQVLKTTGLWVARMSSIPLPATSLLFRSSKPLDFRLAARGCHQYHCRRRRSADLVPCTPIVVSTLVVVAAMKNSARSCCEISAYNNIEARRGIVY